MRKFVTGAVCGALALFGVLVLAAPYVADAVAGDKGSRTDGKEGSGLKQASLGF